MAPDAHWRWLKEELYSHSVRLGQEILERELKRFGCRVEVDDLETLAAELGMPDGEHVYAGIGSGDLSVSRVVNRLIPNPPKRRIRRLLRDRRGIRIQGMDDRMIHFGKCCTPIPGDEIIGLVTRGRGISVHRTDCPNISVIAEDPERLMAVEWDLNEEQSFTIQLRVRSGDRKYLLSDISKVISDTGANIQSSSTKTAEYHAEQTFWIDVKDTRQLKSLIKSVGKVKGVSEVRRVDDPLLPLTL